MVVSVRLANSKSIEYGTPMSREVSGDFPGHGDPVRRASYRGLWPIRPQQKETAQRDFVGYSQASRKIARRTQPCRNSHPSQRCEAEHDVTDEIRRNFPRNEFFEEFTISIVVEVDPGRHWIRVYVLIPKYDNVVRKQDVSEPHAQKGKNRLPGSRATTKDPSLAID